MRVSLSKYPSQNKEHVVDFPRLDGGLNLRELDYRLDSNQSPNMKNLLWQDGVLQCRDGQVYISDDELGTGYSAYDSLFWGRAFFHIGDKLYYGELDEHEQATMTPLVSGVPANRGTFFRYGDWLFYKNAGGFYRIAYAPASGDDPESFTAVSMATIAYTPVAVINTDPETAAGDLYQPENRLSSDKTVWYNAKQGVTDYVIPYAGMTGVDKVVVDGAVLIPDQDYTVDLANHKVVFSAAPAVTDPPTSNTVKITVTAPDADALASVMSCPYATVAGGDTNLCILLGGCAAQPNAVFWNGNDNISMNAAYWPMEFYNLVGDTEDTVTGFGRQYSDIIVFKGHSIGKLNFSVEDLDGRSSISFTYVSINAKTGCDLPWSIQLIENNMVFCNTYQGVHILRSSSAAYENNVDCISRNVNGDGKSRGLFFDLTQYDSVTSFDDDNRYWLCVGGRVYAWDYILSTYEDPSWFYLTDIPAVCFFQDDRRRICHLDANGRVTMLSRVFLDYDRPIEKVYQFPTQHFGSYERLKNVTSLLLAVRSDTDTEISLYYETDYESRYDLTNVASRSWRFVPRNLTYRYLGVARYAHVERRKPNCRHIRHFSLTLRNDVAEQDLAIVSLQLIYNYQGEER